MRLLPPPRRAPQYQGACLMTARPEVGRQAAPPAPVAAAAAAPHTTAVHTRARAMVAATTTGTAMLNQARPAGPAAPRSTAGAKRAGPAAQVTRRSTRARRTAASRPPTSPADRVDQSAWTSKCSLLYKHPAPCTAHSSEVVTAAVKTAAKNGRDGSGEGDAAVA